MATKRKTGPRRSKKITAKAPRINPPQYKVSEIALSLSETYDWSLRLLGVPDIWATTRGQGIRVAVLDTGVDHTHIDLKAAIVGMKDFTRSVSGPVDMNGHGTHVAGIIGARSNGTGIVGVAPECELLIGKVLDDNGFGDYNGIVEGIRWAMQQGADIISMSLGGSSGYGPLHSAIQAANQANVIVVAASGNDRRNDFISFPARYPECIAVGAVNRNLKRAGFSNGNPDLDIMAPGEDIVSTYKGGTYVQMSGTSMATPFVAGICALILSKHKQYPGKTPIRNNQEMLQHLIKNARDLGPAGFDPANGWGLIDPQRSVATAGFSGSLSNSFSAEMEIPGASRGGLFERLYHNHRGKGLTHEKSQSLAAEICMAFIEGEYANKTREEIYELVIGGEGFTERVYTALEASGAGHEESLSHARSLQKVASSVLKK